LHRTPAQAGPQSRCGIKAMPMPRKGWVLEMAGFIGENELTKKLATFWTASAWRNLRSEEKFHHVKPHLPTALKQTNSKSELRS
jgi:hypothetical protein